MLLLSGSLAGPLFRGPLVGACPFGLCVCAHRAVRTCNGTGGRAKGSPARGTALGCSRLLWAVLGCSGLLWAALGGSGRLWAALGCSGLLWAALGCSGLLWAALGCFELLWAALGGSGLLREQKEKP